MIVLRRFVLLVVLGVFSSSCTGYMWKTQGAIRHYENYEYNEAITQFAQLKPAKKDELLYFLDKGMILHAAGKYKESIEAFHAAERVADEVNSHTGHEVLSLAANENVLPYIGQKYERLLISIWNALNYACLGEVREALIEIRHFHVLYHAFYGHDLPKAALRNPFNQYLAGMIWEANGFRDDARIDYRKVHAMNAEIPEATPSEERHMGELVVILEAGLSPTRRSSEWQSPETLQFFPVPQYEARETDLDRIAIEVNGEIVAETSSFVSLTDLAIASLADELPKLTAKAIGRTVLKEGAAVAVGTEVDQDLGIAIGLLLLATNQVDLRHWQTLPDTLSIARVSLPEGTHHLQVHFLGKIGEPVREPLVLENVVIPAGEKVFFSYRVFE